MRSPARTLTGNLRWTRFGTVWADWLLTPVPYGFRSAKDKHVVRGLHQALLRALPGESLLQGVCSGLDAASVVERMIADVDLSGCPDWAAECEATLDSLDAISPGQRSYWLSVPLGDRGSLDRLREPWTSATAGVRDSLALPRAGVSEQQLQRRLEQARRVAAAIPHPFRPRPVTPAQMLWLHLHAQQRGVTADLDLPQGPGGDLSGALLAPRTGMSLSEPVLDEGGQADLTRSQLRAWNPTDRRYLKVSQASRPDDPAASYQSMLVLTDVPAEGMIFPGSEFLGRIDESGLEVDWALRLQVLASGTVVTKNRRALVNLNEQYGQRDGELSHGLGALDRAARELAEYAAVLESDKFEVEVQPTAIFAVGGPDPDSCGSQARSLAGYMADAGYQLSAPLGYQQELWWAMQPGVPASKAVREFAQITTSRALASAVPLASTELGDDRGSLLGLNISTGRPGVVMHDLEGASVRDVSGSIAVIGELGSGKALAVDVPIATPSGWARMGELAAGDQVLDEQGEATTVLAVSPVMIGRECLEVVFCDGSSIVADAKHSWSTLTTPAGVDAARTGRASPASGGMGLLERATRPVSLPPARWHELACTGTTMQLRQVVQAHGPAARAIPAAGPLQLPPVGLAVEPYVLGTRIGIANRPGGAGEDVERAPSGGTAGGAGSGSAGKGIPRVYLRSSIGQRRALLAGLADTTGTTAAGGTCTLTITGRRLAADVHELVCSLGHPAAFGQSPAARGGWRVSFRPDDLVSGTSGTQPTQAASAAGVAGSGVACGRLRHVVEVRPARSVPVRCIQVAAASQLFLAGRSMIPTHNSVLIKKLAGDVVDRGGRVIAVDRTAMGEYARWASSVTRAVVVDVDAPQMSLDPMRLFGRDVGSRVTQTFLSPLLNVAPTSERGVLLSDVLDPAYLTEHDVGSLGALLAHLAAGCALPGATELARVMNVFARRDFGRVVFDDSLAVLPLDTPAIVVRTHTLDLPSSDELAAKHLFDGLGLEKLFGRAMYALVAALARRVCFADASRLGVFIGDEVHHITASPEGERELAVFGRDGRKHKAAALIGTHDAQEDLGSAALRGLIPTRILMRHQDKTLAQRGLAYLGLDPDDDALVQMVTKQTSPLSAQGVEPHRRGEAFLRDAAGNIGRIKVLAPSLPGRAQAVLTSPTAGHDQPHPDGG